MEVTVPSERDFPNHAIPLIGHVQCSLCVENDFIRPFKFDRSRWAVGKTFLSPRKVAGSSFIDISELISRSEIFSFNRNNYCPKPHLSGTMAVISLLFTDFYGSRKAVYFNEMSLEEVPKFSPLIVISVPLGPETGVNPTSMPGWDQGLLSDPVFLCRIARLPM
jgi:hypothetical protein